MPAPPTASERLLLRRFAAALYDAFPLLALWMAVAALMLLAVRGEVDVAHLPVWYRAALQAALLAVSTLYFAVSWHRGGQTIGMRPWRIRVIAAEGGALPLGRALVRFVVALLSLAALGAGFLWAFVDAQGRTWHDRAARSRMVRAA